MYALYVCLVCMCVRLVSRGARCVSWVHALYVFLICTPYMYALYVCMHAFHVCVICMYALYVCFVCMHALNECLICMACMRWVLMASLACVLDVCLVCMLCMYALYVCLICMLYMYAFLCMPYMCLVCMPYMSCFATYITHTYTHTHTHTHTHTTHTHTYAPVGSEPRRPQSPPLRDVPRWRSSAATCELLHCFAALS